MDDALVEQHRIRQEMNAQHSARPEPGDYWADLAVGFAVVVCVEDNDVTICREKVFYHHGKEIERSQGSFNRLWDLTRRAIGADQWTWDWVRVETMPLPTFQQLLRDHDVDVHPRAHTHLLVNTL